MTTEPSPLRIDSRMPDVEGELERLSLLLSRALPREVREVLDGSRRWAVVHGEALVTLLAMPDASVDALITDPPYSSGGMFRGDRAKTTGEKYVLTGTQPERPDFTGDNRSAKAFELWCALWLTQALRVARQGAPGVVFTDWRQLGATANAFEAGGWIHCGTMPWDKVHSRPVMGRFKQQAEFVVWGSNGPMPEERGVDCLPGVVRHYPAPSKKNHQTSKTVGTMMQVVPICSPGGVILDPFAGGGSTGVAALRLGYRFVGIELSPEYVEITREALEKECPGC